MFYTLIYNLLVIYPYPLQLTNTRYCKYSCVCSWWLVDIQPETRRTIYQK